MRLYFINKNKMKTYTQKIKEWVILWISFILTIWAINFTYWAYTSLTTVNSWTILTKDIWNQMVSNLDDLDSRIKRNWADLYISWAKLWIWTDMPLSTLEVNWTLRTTWAAPQTQWTNISNWMYKAWTCSKNWEWTLRKNAYPCVCMNWIVWCFTANF